MKQYVGFNLVKDNRLYGISIYANTLEDAISKIKNIYHVETWILCPNLNRYLNNSENDLIENVISEDYHKYCFRNHINDCCWED